MADKTHSLGVIIDASAARKGSDQFVAAINAIKAAVRGLEKDTAGAFTQLSKGAKVQVDTSAIKAANAEFKTATGGAASFGDAARRAAISASTALRVSQVEAQRMGQRLNALGDTSGIAELNGSLDQLKTKLATANTPLDAREARASYKDVSDSLKRRAVDLEAVNRAEAAAASAQHSSELDRLRNKYNPLYAASVQYETALSEINMAERQGVISSQLASKARADAANVLATGSTQLNKFGAASKASASQVTNLSYQLNDIGVMLAAGQNPLMLAMQQGTQVNQVFAQMGGGKQALAGIGSAFLSIINPMSLATIGIIAGGAALVQWGVSAFGAGEKAKTLSEQVGDLSGQTGKYVTAAQNATRTVRELRGEFDIQAGAASRLYDRLAALERLRSVAVLQDAAKTLSTTFEDVEARVKRIDTEMMGDGGDLVIARQARKLNEEFGLSVGQARALVGLLKESATAQSAEGLASAMTRVSEFLADSAESGKALSPVMRDAAISAAEAAVEGLRISAAADAALSSTSAATSATDAWRASMSGVLQEINAIMGALGSVGSGVIQNQSKQVELDLLARGKGIQAAAQGRARHEKDREWQAREIGAKARGGVGGWVER